jgi:hypothetical protein
MFDELRKIIPRADHNDPRALSGWLTAAALEDPAGARRPGFLAADAALQELNSALDLQSRIATVFHDPKLRAEVGVERIEAALRDPEGAYAELIQKSAAGKLSPQLNEALNVLGEAREFARENGAEWTAAPPPPIPSDSTARETEIAALNLKSINRAITPAERERQLQLYEQRLAGESAAETEPKTAGRPRDGAGRFQQPDKPSGEYARLLEKSIGRGGLSATERSRMLTLAADWAIASGQVSADDVQAELDAEEQ